jgi:4'-phosphopantetheinyl transferase
MLGRFAAKNALASLVGEEDYRSISIERGIFGQPIVRHQPSIGYDISISHNHRQAVAIAFDAGHPMGIDIEEFEPALYETLLKAVPDEETRFWDRRSENPNPELLLVLWTVKEALSKALRCGMMTPASVLAIESLDRSGSCRYQSVFRNFGQYKALSWLSEGTVISIVLPLHTEIEFEPFQLGNIINRC